MSDVFICEGPNHEGNRLITDPWDRFEGRRELRRMHDHKSPKIAKEFNFCKACGLQWIAEIRPRAAQLSLLPNATTAPKPAPSPSGVTGAQRVREVLEAKEREREAI